MQGVSMGREGEVIGSERSESGAMNAKDDAETGLRKRITPDEPA